MFLLGLIIGGLLVAAYLYDREQDAQGEGSDWDDFPEEVEELKKREKHDK